MILKLFITSRECNLYKRGGTVQQHAKGHHFERSYRPNDAKLKGDYLNVATCWGLLVIVIRKLEMVVLKYARLSQWYVDRVQGMKLGSWNGMWTEHKA